MAALGRQQTVEPAYQVAELEKSRTVTQAAIDPKQTYLALWDEAN
jgi:hypothetical protein